MTKYNLCLLLVLFGIPSFAFQTDSSIKYVNESDSNEIFGTLITDGEILIFPEIQPTYPGGMDQLRRDVLIHFDVPRSYMKNESSGGEIVAQFTVFSNGSIGDISLLKGMKDCKICNQNAIKMIESIPKKFTPGYQDGEAVDVRIVVPIIVKYRSR